MVDLKIAPSLLAADFLRLGEQLELLVDAGVDWIHFDIMDGIFVPNIALGTAIVQSVANRYKGKAILDVHLMTIQPGRRIRQFIDAGADIVTFHADACTDTEIRDALDEIDSAGVIAGLTIKPDTSEQTLAPYLDRLGVVMVMTVEPGYGGQAFLSSQLPKISALRKMIAERGLDCELEVDGGVTLETARLCVEAGATVLVVGSSLFSIEPADSVRAYVGRLKRGGIA